MAVCRQKHLSGGGETGSSLTYRSFDASFWGGGGELQDGFPFQAPISAALYSQELFGIH